MTASTELMKAAATLLLVKHVNKNLTNTIAYTLVVTGTGFMKRFMQ